jgi:polar amino acid transport system substrate-binding protein
MTSERRRYWPVILAIAVTAVLVSTAVFVSQPPREDASALTFYTEVFPPYNYVENGTAEGLSVDLLEAVTAKMGSPVTAEKVRVVPWTVGYQAASNSTKSVLFSTFRIPQREQTFKWAGPISVDKYVLFSGWDSKVAINSTADLNAYRIGVITDDAAVTQLLSAGVERSHLVCETSASALVQKLAAGEIDLWCYPEVVGRYLTQQVTEDYYSFRVAWSLDSIDCYYAFSRDVPDSLVRSFQQALDSLKKEKDPKGVSAYDRIVGRYIPSIGLANLNYLTEDWAPFNFVENGTAAGVSVDILEEVFRNLGVNRTRANVGVVPLADAFQQAQGDNGTVVFSIVRSPSRESLYKWAGPFTKSSFVIYAKLSRNITIGGPQDLNEYVIGAVESTIENQLLIDQGVSPGHIVNGALPSDLLHLLSSGGIDLWATGDLTGHSEMVKAGLDPEEYGIVYVLSENDFYFIFSRDVPDTLVSSFQNAIQFVRQQPDASGVTPYERIIYRYLGAGHARQTFSDDAVTGLVNLTAAAVQADAAEAFRRMNAGEAPFINSSDRGLYAFVYDVNVTAVANAANPLVTGVNFKGKTDVAGTPFRDLIVQGALANGTGWVDYIFMNPSQTNLYYKTTYYRLVTGSDGHLYVVCSGNYKSHG